MPHDNYIPSTLLLLTKFLLTLSRSTKIKNDSQRTSLCSALCHPILPSLHFAACCVVLASSRSSQLGICPSLASAVRLVTCATPPLVSCREAPWTTALHPWSSNIRRARSNGRILQLGRLNISRPSTALSSNRFALLD